MTLPSITIVTPSFNQAKFLETTMRSVLDQNYSSLEYIVMDGGSSDGSVDIIRRYSDRLAYWQSCPDGGQAAAIAGGFKRGSGEILAWLNSDDLLLPGSLETVGAFFRDNREEEWLIGGCMTIEHDGSVSRGRFGVMRGDVGTRMTTEKLLFWGCRGFNQPAVFWRRSAYEAVGGLNPSYYFCMDYDLFVRLSLRRASGRTRGILACFRYHPASKTATAQDVHAREKHLLWTKYGLYEHSPLYRRLRYALYFIIERTQYRAVQVGLTLGFGKCPFPQVR